MGEQTMTQSQIIQTLAEQCETTKKVAASIIAALAQTAIGEVKKNGVFVLPGIGRLVRADRKARTGRNPATGEAIKIPAKKGVKFRVAKSVKDAIGRPQKAEIVFRQDHLARSAAAPEWRPVLARPASFLCWLPLLPRSLWRL